jgi:hypothetical protein
MKRRQGESVCLNRARHVYFHEDVRVQSWKELSKRNSRAGSRNTTEKVRAGKNVLRLRLRLRYGYWKPKLASIPEPGQEKLKTDKPALMTTQTFFLLLTPYSHLPDARAVADLLL